MRTLAVIALCLAASAFCFGHAVVNPDVPVRWLAVDLALAAGALLLRGGSLLAGGLIANALVAQLCGGVPDFIPVAGRLLSPGDVAIALGFLPIALSVNRERALSGRLRTRPGAGQRGRTAQSSIPVHAHRYSRPVRDESFASDC